MVLRRPRSTLCPYTTLFRSDRGGFRESERRASRIPRLPRPGFASRRRRRGGLGQSAVASRRDAGRAPGVEARLYRVAAGRSEEHTSELQSLAYLVCRLLLEK